MNKDHRNGVMQLSPSVYCTHLPQYPHKHTRVTLSSINYLSLKGEDLLPYPDIL